MHISFRDFRGRELDDTSAPDGEQAVYQAMSLLARRRRLNAGDMLIVDDDSVTAVTEQMVAAAGLVAVAGRLERAARAVAADRPDHAADLRTAAGMCRHAARRSGVTLVA